ncbi:MAG: cytochrome c [Nitrospira sp.]|nr:cytochrome c [Nitrospira sp.]
MVKGLVVINCLIAAWAWVAIQPGMAQSDIALGDVSKGKVLFDRNCAGCHGTEGKGNGYKLLGPDPADLTSRRTAAKSDGELLKTIHDGKPNMPAWKNLLSEEQARDILAYVRTLTR